MVLFIFDYLLPLLGGLMLIICVLIGVAFLTLLERKVLGYIQIRKGPNKVGFMGIPQPFSDAIKLFTKEQTYPSLSNYFLYYFSPVFSLYLSLLVWIVFPFFTSLFSFNFGLLFFLCCTSMGVYTLMIAGWSSNSNYALLGGLRAVAQTISYEVSLALILFSFIFLIESYSLMMFSFYQLNIWFFFISFPLALSWFASCLAETNRTPFDFAEGESELVSGFNVEYSSGGFALIFMAEYASILFMSMLFCVIFLGCDVMTIMFFMKVTFLSFMFIWVRGTLPRFRYDKLMYLAWKSFLPLSLNYLFFFVGLKILFFCVN
uniref:NADH-ubiquinone oxidoreductase chain 1 n=2 Tax=Diestrammena asynamora TaxID=470930 RepID=A0A1Q1MPJ0_9ORTH|nr:NADH dehydrogenase subunit 1 [Diestrammena asynamora]AQM40005.1 NADH dehydrogenase subunit 1 [Diestrammena asynamora]